LAGPLILLDVTSSARSATEKETSLKHRLVALTALVTVALTAGCGLESVTINGGSPTAQPTAAAPTPTGKEEAGTNEASQEKAAENDDSVKDGGDLPDPCTLLSGTEVRDLTDRNITQIDKDGAQPGDITRYCQWQQAGGQLALFLSRTTAADFRVTVAEAEQVDGVGEDAFWHSGHLYVLYGTVQIDVYSRGGSEAANQADASKVAKVVIPNI
jgi:hypothetical protein